MALRANQFINAPYTITTTTVNKTLDNFEYCIVPTSGGTGITLTLPRGFVGNKVKISVFDKTNVIIDRNGEKIMNLDDNLTINLQYATIEFVYVDNTIGWRIS